MTRNADKVIRVWPDTKERFDSYQKGNGTADRVLNNMLDKMGVPR